MTEPVFLNYPHDREIPEGLWNSYLKKYRDKYKVRPDEIDIWQILCKYGTIQTYSILKHELCFAGEYKSAKGVNNIKKSIPKFCTITQEGVCDIVVKFPEKQIHNVAKLFQVRKKRQLSPEHLAKLLKASEQYRFKPLPKKQEDTVVRRATALTKTKTTSANSKTKGVD